MSTVSAAGVSAAAPSGVSGQVSSAGHSEMSFAELLGITELPSTQEGEYWFDLYDQLKHLAEQEDWQFNQDEPFWTQLTPEGQFRVISIASQFDGEVQQQLVQMMRRADGLQSVDVMLGQAGHKQTMSSTQGEHHMLNFSQAVERMMANAMVPVRPEFNNPELLQPANNQASLSMLMAQTGNFASTAQTSGEVQSTQAEWAPIKVDENKQAWGQQMLSVLKDRVQMQMNQDISQARIRLDPPHLGTLELSVKVENHKVHVQLFASDPTLREAISSQAERLRTDLETKQLAGASVDVDVSDQPQEQDEPLFASEHVIAESNWEDSTLLTTGPEDHRITRII
ncbi:flagellar hook-length control protein FliK [Vibrio sp. WXL103]|uniref:flagellar hook-length control protein FliK n=1 Tax=Vibrio sp. WXL103 TaxID=3450710 RepID=UPI003EC660D7